MFNIITATYNRKHTIKRVYDSLISQTFKQFNWIIIDDASTDNTFELIQEWQKSALIEIEYYRMPENQGKSIAINFGLKYCHEPYTIVADSDDSFDPNTLLDLGSIWSVINLSSINTSIASIWTLTKDESDLIIGDKFPKDIWLVNFKNRVLENNITGEKWACWRTNVLSHYKMYFNANCHIGESHTWNRINIEHDFLCVNIAHRYYFHSPDGMIARKKSKRELAMFYFYGSYHELDRNPIGTIIKYNYLRKQAFDHIKAKFHFNDNKFKLPFSKKFISFIIFLLKLPNQLIKRVS